MKKFAASFFPPRLLSGGIKPLTKDPWDNDRRLALADVKDGKPRGKALDSLREIS